jgi:hypothetical protein
MAFPYSPKSALHDAVVREIFRSNLVFAGWKSEEQHRRDIAGTDLIDFAVELLIDRKMKDSRHGRHFARDLAAMHEKQRLDQVGRGELVLTHQLAQRRRAATSAWAVSKWKRHMGKMSEREAAPQPPQPPRPAAGTCFAFFSPRTSFPDFTFLSRRLYNRKGWSRASCCIAEAA